MTIYRRIVFGEPRPGGAKFASILSTLYTNVSYCNRTGPLKHDRVTDVPFDVPVLGLNFQQPEPLQFISAAPLPNDSWGIFSLHHIQLYVQGAVAAKLDTIHIQAVQYCAAIYDPTSTWDKLLAVAGVVCGIKLDGTRAYVVFRGSDDIPDWIRDVTPLDPSRIIIHDTFGEMWGGFLIGMSEVWSAIKPLIASATEVVFTGHSLGAARADIATGYALMGM